MRRSFLGNSSRSKIFIEIVSFLLIVLWIYAAISQLTQLHNFHVRLGQFPFIGNYADVLYWLLPVTELIAAFLFFFSQTKMAGLIFSSVLLLLFTGYILALLYFADSIPCSCSGVIPSLSWTQHLFFNVGCFIMALLGVAYYPTFNQNRKYS